MKFQISNFNKTAFISCLLILVFINLILNIFGVIYLGLNDVCGSYISFVILIFCFLYLRYFGVKQSKILLPDFLLETKEKVNDKKETPFTTICLSEKELNDLKVKLDSLLKVKKMYLNPNLTLDMLSLEIEITSKELSYYINKKMNTNFHSLINLYRLKDVKEKLISKEYNKYTFIGIAYESGFNSKTSFYRLFKEETGMSPSEYKNKYSR